MDSWLLVLLIFTASGCLPAGAERECNETGRVQGRTVLPGVTVLTGFDLKPSQTRFCRPELADPYATQLADSVIISGTAQYHLKFQSLGDLQRGGPYQVVWNEFRYPDGTPMAAHREHAHSWDMKPVLWTPGTSGDIAQRAPASKLDSPRLVWYGGHMRPQPGQKTALWPQDNYSRDVFAFIENSPGMWFSLEDSLFLKRGDWPRLVGNHLGHRYGHQIVMVPKLEQGKLTHVPAVFYEEVTSVKPNGAPAVTRIFMDEMVTPFQARGAPVELASPFNPSTGRAYPSAIREDGAVLFEGPLYFRFDFEGELWEGIGFSAGSFYGKYPASFAARKLSDGLQGKPFQLDLSDDGSDLHDAGAELGALLNLAGGPARPAVLVTSDGMALSSPERSGALQVLVHAYRRDILPDHDFKGFPTKYRLDQMFRVIIHTFLHVERTSKGTLRFRILAPKGVQPDWG